MRTACAERRIVATPASAHPSIVTDSLLFALIHSPQVAKRDHVPKAGAEFQSKFGVVVRTCRQQLGITQEELAWRADMHRTYIADIERGARNVTLRSVVNLAKALEVTVEALFSDVTAPSGKAGRGGAETARAEACEILLVEDNATDAALTMRAFKRAKMTNPLRIVQDAEEGLDYLFGTGRYAKKTPQKPQLILLDLNLPKMTGLEFLRLVKADKRTCDIPVVVLTVSQSDRMIVECGRLGAENYIIKPVAMEGFLRVTPKLNLRLTLRSPTAAEGKVDPL